jgi:hypothetical protein
VRQISPRAPRARAYLPLRTAVTLGCFIAARRNSFFSYTFLTMKSRSIVRASTISLKSAKTAAPRFPTRHLAFGIGAPANSHSLSFIMGFLDSRFRFVRFFCMALSVRRAAFRIRSSHSVLLLMLRPFLLIRLQLPSDLCLCQDDKSRCMCALPPARPRQSLLTEAALIYNVFGQVLVASMYCRSISNNYSKSIVCFQLCDII